MPRTTNIYEEGFFKAVVILGTLEKLRAALDSGREPQLVEVRSFFTLFVFALQCLLCLIVKRFE